jgi:serine/threonine-protein kinase
VHGRCRPADDAARAERGSADFLNEAASTVSSSSTTPSTTSLLPPGRAIGGYTIERVLGEGASGIVYAAKAPDQARVALKVIHREHLADRQIFGRFRREAAILTRLEGEHLVKLLEFVEDQGLLAIALEYVDGVSLESVLKERSALPLGEAIEIALQICAALGSAHAAGVIHRDLKPANVLVESAGGGADVRVRVVDFGLAKAVHGEHGTTGLTEQDMIFGTPEYMAPEQARGDEADFRCDLYAAGVILYEMAIGKVPFKGPTAIATMTAQLTEEPPPARVSAPNRPLSPALEAVVMRALSKDRDARYPSARAFAEALAAAREQLLVIAPAKIDDPLSFGTNDTDLNVAARTSLEHSLTVRSDPTSQVVAEAETERKPQSKERWLWAVVAIVAAAIGIGIGVLFGTR